MGKEVVEMGDKVQNLWKMCASHNLLALSVFFLLTIKMIFLKVRYVASLPKTPNLRSDWYGGPASYASRCFRGKPRDLPMYQPAKMMSHAAPKTMTSSIPRNFKNCELFYGSNFSIFSS